MLARGSPKLSAKLVAMAHGTKKKCSPKCSRPAKTSPKAKQRAYWNPSLEKSLVDILHEYKNSGYRGDNGWNSEGWNKMVKVFHERNKYVSFTKAQIQDKKGQLKRDYKMLKEARRQSGSRWNEERSMIEGDSFLWDNLIVSYPKIKKFRNVKATFSLYEALGELYDGHLAEGTYNVTSLDFAKRDIPDLEDETLRQIEDPEDLVDLTEEPEENRTESGEADGHKNVDIEAETPAVDRSGHRRRAAAIPKHKEEKKPKRPRRSTANIKGMMEKYWELRTKQVEDETKEREQALAREKELASEKEVARGPDFSLMRCVAVLNNLEVTKVEKAKAYAVFKTKVNREIFLNACSEDPEAALIWLRSEMT